MEDINSSRYKKILFKRTHIIAFTLLLQSIVILMLLGATLRLNYQVNICKQENQQKKEENSPTLLQKDSTWTTYVDNYRRFSIKFPTDTIARMKKINAYYSEDIEPYTTELISSSEDFSFTGASLEISDVQYEPSIPSNFEVKSEENMLINERYSIYGTKKFGYLKDTSGKETYAVYYLIFERNAELYLVQYAQYASNVKNNRSVHDNIFDTIVSSTFIDGESIINESELLIKDSQRFYIDPILEYSIPVPDGWNIRHGGDHADPLIILTNEPAADIYELPIKSVDSKYIRIYLSGGSVIFSTSGGLCFNAGCIENGSISLTINGKNYVTDVVSYGTLNRFIIDTETVDTGGVYIAATYPLDNVSVATVQNILSSIEFK